MKSETTSAVSLPEKFRRFFWDVAFDELDFSVHSRFIAERLLNNGNTEEVRWLLKHTSRPFLKSVLENSRNLNAKTKNYWHLMLGK